MLQPKFSGVLGEALDVAARWSGDVVSTLSKVSILTICPLLSSIVLKGAPRHSLVQCLTF